MYEQKYVCYKENQEKTKNAKGYFIYFKLNFQISNLRETKFKEFKLKKLKLLFVLVYGFKERA